MSWVGWGGTEKGGESFHHSKQNSVLFKTYEWFISGIFYLIFWVNHGAKTMKSETADKCKLLYRVPFKREIH